MKKIAVIGSGVMGAGIAAQIANSGHEVMLFDLLLETSQKSIENLLQTRPAPLTSRKKVELISAASLENNFDELSQCDWIIEVIIEDLEIKKDLYRRIDLIKKNGAIISSNTSTLPLEKLIENLSIEFQQNFLITHFFNPPRYMRLLELITHANNNLESVGKITTFIESHLGKIVVPCKDSPGFIANRIGCFWLETGLNEAIKHNLNLAELDSSMSEIFSIPKTGIFGLWDLIGLDLMPLIGKSLINNLPHEDYFVTKYQQHDVVTTMVENGYSGRKGKGGFYRIIKDDNAKKTKQIMNLTNGKYEQSPKLTKIGISLENSINSNVEITKHSFNIMAEMLYYSLNIAEDIAINIHDIDVAMKTGYNWKFGPFEIIDQIGHESFAKYLEKNSKSVPELLKNSMLNGNKFYKENKSLNFNMKYEETYSNFIKLSEIEKIAIKENDSAVMWDIGDEVACLEFKTKMNILNENIFDLILEITSEQYEIEAPKALIIGGYSENFCAGADLNVFYGGTTEEISEFISKGQKAMMSLKHAKFPVISATSGFALGGGCELILHSHAICAHIETYAGLVEGKLGLIPGWGGTKEMALRGEKFDNIINQKISSSADELIEMRLSNSRFDKVIMNYDMLLSEAKKLAIHMKDQDFSCVYSFKKCEFKFDENDEYSNKLKQITEAGNAEEDLLNKEKEIFIDLISQPNIKEKILKFI